MAHRDPTSPSWHLAAASKAAWEDMVAGRPRLAAAAEWQATGSLLLATAPDEVDQLAARAAMLQQQGVRGVSVLSQQQLRVAEPALQLPPGSSGLLVESDAQINGRATAFALLGEIQRLGAASGRCQVLLHEPVHALHAGGAGAAAVVVHTAERALHARRGVVVAAGVWSGALLAEASGDARWRRLLAPRRGHLLEVAAPPGMPALARGVMELSYARHYSNRTGGGGGGGGEGGGGDGGGGGGSGSGSGGAGGGGAEGVDITFTATSSASGSLLLGSSREFSGWDSAASADIVAAILDRAVSFLPHLAGLDPSGPGVRVGLRPYALGGLPALGPVPGLPGVFAAAGHEGSGLCLGPATARLVARHVVGGPQGGGGGGGGGGGVEGEGWWEEALLPAARLAAAVAVDAGG